MPIDQLRLQRLFEDHPALEPLYRKMHELRELLSVKHRTKRECRPLVTSLLHLLEQLRKSTFALLLTLYKTLDHWNESLGAMWRFTRNNGITEGFHRKMKLIQRRAYGSKNFHNYRLRVIALCG